MYIKKNFFFFSGATDGGRRQYHSLSLELDLSGCHRGGVEPCSAVVLVALVPRKRILTGEPTSLCTVSVTARFSPSLPTILVWVETPVFGPTGPGVTFVVGTVMFICLSRLPRQGRPSSLALGVTSKPP